MRRCESARSYEQSGLVELRTSGRTTIRVSSNSPDVWSGPSASHATREVTAISPSQTVGTLVCTGGTPNRKTCSVRIDAWPVSVSYSGKTIRNQVDAHQTADHAAFTPGASGGPVYSVASNGVAKAYGMVVAADQSDYSYGTYTSVTNITSAAGLGVTVNGLPLPPRQSINRCSHINRRRCRAAKRRCLSLEVLSGGREPDLAASSPPALTGPVGDNSQQPGRG